MALAGFNHSSMLTDLHHEDYISPEPFGLILDRSIELQTMESLLNYSTTLTNLLPTYSDPSSSSSGTNSPTSEFPHQQYSILGSENGENNPSTYSSTSAMLSFDHLENYPMLLAGSLHANNTMNHGVIDHNLLEASMEDHIAEKQLRWLYSGNAGNDRLFYESDELLGAIHKRPYMGMDDVQPNKRQCVDTQKSSRPTVCKDPQSLAAKNRRERINERLRVLQELVPNGTKVDLVTMLDKAFHYVKCLQLQVKVLATDEFWPAHGGKAPEDGEVTEAIDAILASHRDANSSPNTTALRTESPKP